MDAPAQLPERVEVAAYYVVSEALTNAAKHANASVIHVNVEADGQILHLRVRNDGTGGADPARGSGLVGLKDRVEALGGTITIQSPAGSGTSLHAKLPLATAPSHPTMSGPTDLCRMGPAADGGAEGPLAPHGQRQRGVRPGPAISRGGHQPGR